MGAGNVIKVIGDGAYDSIGPIRHLERRGIETYYKAEEECRGRTEGLPPEGLQPG
jgi:hypothetical protein